MPAVDADVLIVGSGPAGVSAAFPLVDAGVSVLLVDGGEEPDRPAPQGEYLALRRSDVRQAEWMIGHDGYALAQRATASPKFRVPSLAFAFRGYADTNRIVASDFTLIGSLAVGGLSNAWGCGVTRFDAADWNDLPVGPAEWNDAFASVAARVAVCGRSDDDLGDFFGLDEHAHEASRLDALHARIWQGYYARRNVLRAAGFRLGRARMAVLHERGRPGREPCDARGVCLWGCPRGAMYNARQDLPVLAARSSFVHRSGVVVQRLVRVADVWRVEAVDRRGMTTVLHARYVVLAAGAIASTAIAMRSLPGFSRARLLHVPTAAFALLVPRALGEPARPNVGFAQLAFTLDGDRPQETCGYTFATTGLPVSEFARHAPMSRATAATLFRELLPSVVVVNVFMPSRYSQSRLELQPDGTVTVLGGESEALDAYAKGVRARLASAFRRTGAFMLPRSFSRGSIGSDVHYASTMPMSERPRLGECDVNGAVAGVPGLYVVDGASLPALPAKSHTLSIMANAHRIASRLAARLRAY